MTPALHPLHEPAHAHTPWETVQAPAEPVRELSLEVCQADSLQIVERIDADGCTHDKPAGGGLFTLPLLCLGIGVIACCVLVPAADENRRLGYEHLRLQADLDQITRQIEVNSEFLKRVADDPTLSERLAQRQMKMVRQGTSVLELKGSLAPAEMSPFQLVTLPPPPELAPYQPAGGKLATLCRNAHSQLYLMGAGLLMVAAGLVLGTSSGD